jgi:hypothetical protein
VRYEQFKILLVENHEVFAGLTLEDLARASNPSGRRCRPSPEIALANARCADEVNGC